MEPGARTLVLVCRNVDCESRGGNEIMERLKQAFTDGDQIEVRPYMCFGACHRGPNIVIYPQRQWLSGVRPADVPEIVQALQEGYRVERICDKIDEGVREFIYNLLDAGIY